MGTCRKTIYWMLCGKLSRFWADRIGSTDGVDLSELALAILEQVGGEGMAEGLATDVVEGGTVVELWS
jgi:hypothetical protein